MVTRKIIHKEKDGTVVEVDIGAEAKNVTQDADHRFATDTEKTAWNDANSKKHSHSNKGVIDKVTQALLDNWNAAYTHISDAVKHITATERTNWNDANSKKHTHGNKSVIDKVTQAMLDKLSGIAAGAEVNVQSDWNVADNTADAFIKNKPTSMPASDVAAWAKAASKPSYSWSEIGGKPSTFTPATHNHTASQVTQDATHRFVTDTEKAKWNEIDEVKQSLEKYASITVTGEILNLPGGGDIAVTGEILSIPLRI